jgi:hypothetical protein
MCDAMIGSVKCFRPVAVGFADPGLGTSRCTKFVNDHFSIRPASACDTHYDSASVTAYPEVQLLENKVILEIHGTRFVGTQIQLHAPRSLTEIFESLLQELGAGDEA